MQEGERFSELGRICRAEKDGSKQKRRWGAETSKQTLVNINKKKFSQTVRHN